MSERRRSREVARAVGPALVGRQDDEKQTGDGGDGGNSHPPMMHRARRLARILTRCLALQLLLPKRPLGPRVNTPSYLRFLGHGDRTGNRRFATHLTRFDFFQPLRCAHHVGDEIRKLAVGHVPAYAFQTSAEGVTKLLGSIGHGALRFPLMNSVRSTGLRCWSTDRLPSLQDCAVARRVRFGLRQPMFAEAHEHLEKTAADLQDARVARLQSERGELTHRRGGRDVVHERTILIGSETHMTWLGAANVALFAAPREAMLSAYAARP